MRGPFELEQISRPSLVPSKHISSHTPPSLTGRPVLLQQSLLKRQPRRCSSILKKPKPCSPLRFAPRSHHHHHHRAGRGSTGTALHTPARSKPSGSCQLSGKTHPSFAQAYAVHHPPETRHARHASEGEGSAHSVHQRMHALVSLRSASSSSSSSSRRFSSERATAAHHDIAAQMDLMTFDDEDKALPPPSSNEQGYMMATQPQVAVPSMLATPTEPPPLALFPSSQRQSPPSSQSPQGQLRFSPLSSRRASVSDEPEGSSSAGLTRDGAAHALAPFQPHPLDVLHGSNAFAPLIPSLAEFDEADFDDEP